MKGWWKLYKKDLYAILFFLLVVILLVSAWQLFLYYRINRYPSELVFGLGLIPFLFFPLLMLWQGYQGFRREWKEETAYFLLSLPRPGWQLALSKLLAGVTFYLVTIGYSILLLYLVNGSTVTDIFRHLPEVIERNVVGMILTRVFIFSVISGIAIYILSQFAFLIGRFYERFNGLVSILVYILSVYITFRGGSILAPLLNWLPNLSFPVQFSNSGLTEVRTLYLGSGPIFGSIVIIIVLFWLGSYVLAEHLEV
ncbi:MAG: hypothetical protein ACOCQN_00700 [Halanaerobiaceae bacterium]